MYQFYYSKDSKSFQIGEFKDDVSNHFNITAIRPTMWEEHCLECSAPLCFENCAHYKARSDGRCMRFENGIHTYKNDKANCKQGAQIAFRKWANMMTIIFPAMLDTKSYNKLFNKNQKLGKLLKLIESCPLPRPLRWQAIRTIEFIRRKKLRSLNNRDNTPDAFVFHGYSHIKESFNLIIEIFDSHTSVFKMAININPGENLKIIPKNSLSADCTKPDFLVKVYPENDIEAKLDILWCDFVKGSIIESVLPSSKVKCVVWDLDNTLWNGTLIESEPDTLELNDKVEDLIIKLDERGIIQSIASKNDFDAAWKEVERLGLSEYFLYPQIHWNAKSESIRQIAADLNIGVDTFALIDDSVFEREQVKSALPQVRVYDAIEIEDLISKSEFDVIITAESKNRRKMYQAEKKRNDLQLSNNNDTIEFLKKCNLQINIFSPTKEQDILRCYELVIRTNQLNMSGKKYTEDEFNAVLNRPNHSSFAFSCKDDFGEYGIVGFGQYKTEQGAIIFTEFAMSCRVAGKYVESALFKALLEKENCNTGSFKINKTKKNILLRNTLKDIGFNTVNEDNSTIEYEFSNNLNNSELVTFKFSEA